VYLCLPCLYCSDLLLFYCGYVPLVTQHQHIGGENEQQQATTI
jgi:hypothetical protein